MSDETRLVARRRLSIGGVITILIGGILLVFPGGCSLLGFGVAITDYLARGGRGEPGLDGVIEVISGFGLIVAAFGFWLIRVGLRLRRGPGPNA
jgi:hypothetical protein